MGRGKINGLKRAHPCAMLFFLVVLLLSVQADVVQNRYSYAVVVSSAAYSDATWRSVADSLVRKHAQHGTARLVFWTSSVNESADSLKVLMPDYIGFVARPATECNTAFVVAASKLCRVLDIDPYGDAVWGIITGYEAADALRAISASLEVKTVLSASGNLSYEPPIRRFYQAVGMTCDSYTKTDYLFSGSAGKIYTENKRPQNESDRIKLVAAWLNSSNLSITAGGQGTISGPVDCIITGGHGNINTWQCHYPEAGNEGYMTSSQGQLAGAPFSGSAIPIAAVTPKVYWCASNCLMGNPDNKNNVVYAAFHSGNAVQMFGFMNNASAGDEFMAWGTYDRVTKSAGSITLPQGFFLSNNNAQFELEHPTGLIDTRLVKQFMDSTVIYGDPAGSVTFYHPGDSAQAYTSALSYVQTSGTRATFTFTYTMIAHDLEYGLGYSYQFRPVQLLPVRIDPKSVAILKNDGHDPVVTDNLLMWEMLAKGEVLKRGETRTLSWSADVDDKTTVVDKNIFVTRVSSAKPCRIRYAGGKLLVYHARGVGQEYHITNVAGKVAAQGFLTATSSEADVLPIDRRLPKGVYIASLQQEHGVVCQQFTIY